jgi:hypothetical protein
MSRPILLTAVYVSGRHDLRIKAGGRDGATVEHYPIGISTLNLGKCGVIRKSWETPTGD